jgi:hypothetical protein
MRYYTTKPLNGGTTFKCIYCEHSVSTVEFNSTNRNRRTQAATAINQHVALLHSRMSGTVWYTKGLVPVKREARS